jgi:hypothetical protein
MKRFKGKLSYKRDPHLPDPVTCDWLLQQEWSKCVRCVGIHFSNGETESSKLMNFLHATIGIGTDHVIEVFIPDELIPILRDDARVRQAMQALEELGE